MLHDNQNSRFFCFSSPQLAFFIYRWFHRSRRFYPEAFAFFPSSGRAAALNSAAGGGHEGGTEGSGGGWTASEGGEFNRPCLGDASRYLSKR